MIIKIILASVFLLVSCGDNSSSFKNPKQQNTNQPGGDNPNNDNPNTQQQNNETSKLTDKELDSIYNFVYQNVGFLEKQENRALNVSLGYLLQSHSKNNTITLVDSDVLKMARAMLDQSGAFKADQSVEDFIGRFKNGN